MKKELNERTNNSIVPKIFIKGKYIGMLSQLKEYEATGKLFELTGTERPEMNCDLVGGCVDDQFSEETEDTQESEKPTETEEEPKESKDAEKSETS